MKNKKILIVLSYIAVYSGYITLAILIFVGVVSAFLGKKFDESLIWDKKILSIPKILFILSFGIFILSSFLFLLHNIYYSKGKPGLVLSHLKKEEEAS